MNVAPITLPKPERDERDSWLSVTTILKLAGLSPWQDVTLEMLRRGVEYGLDERKLRYVLQGVDPVVLDRKAELGKMVHQACQDIEHGMTEPWWDGLDITPYVEAYLRFKQETGYVAAATEEQVFNEAYRFRGTLDSRGTMGEIEALLDIKTIVQMGGHLAYQLAGYELALPANPRRYRFGLQLKKDGSYQLHSYTGRQDGQIFLAALAVAQAKRSL